MTLKFQKKIYFKGSNLLRTDDESLPIKVCQTKQYYPELF
jgi:hypothetical protein